MDAGNSKQRFLDYLAATFPDGKQRTRSALIKQEYANRIVRFLKGDREEDKHFRFLVKRNNFELIDFPKLGLRDVLITRIKETKQVSFHFLIFKDIVTTIKKEILSQLLFH